MGKHQFCEEWSELGIAGCIGVPRLSKQKVQNGKRGCRELGKQSGRGDWCTGFSRERWPKTEEAGARMQGCET